VNQPIDWSNVVAASFRVQQTIRYDYPSAITDLRHKLMISPRAEHGNQIRTSNDLAVIPDSAQDSDFDAFGNEVITIDVPRIEKSISFVLTSDVVRDTRIGQHYEDTSFAKKNFRASNRRLIRADVNLNRIAADLRVRYLKREELAYAISDFVYNEMVYTHDVTDVFTTGATAFEMRRGVCQDYAHIAITLSRLCGLAARYVSGYLIGEGATHAWVEFLIPSGPNETRVLSLDPTNDCVTNLKYIVVGIGRDYDDVAPTSGFFTGKSAGTITSCQSVRVTDLTYAAPALTAA